MQERNGHSNPMTNKNMAFPSQILLYMGMTLEGPVQPGQKRRHDEQNMYGMDNFSFQLDNLPPRIYTVKQGWKRKKIIENVLR